MEDSTKQLGVASLALLTGFTEYLVYRDWGADNATVMHLAVRLVDESRALESHLQGIPNPFGDIHGWMPDYLAGVGGSLLGIGIKKTKEASQQLSGIAMLTGVFLANEIGQHYGITPGAFDMDDIYAFLAGGATAFGIARWTTNDTLESTLNQPL